jgi:ABC-type nitrate/sulfonate/bicarbonate transport system ATPase subunit
MNGTALQPVRETAFTSREEPEAVAIEGVGLSYGSARKKHDILQGIDLRIDRGDFVCVLGPSGCGKTSLLRILAGYVAPTEGTVSVFGRRQTAPSPEVGVVFQHANLFPWLTVRGNVEFGLKMARVPKPERRRRVDPLLEQIGLAGSAHLLPHQLSGGMKQRTALARTLVTGPKLVLMDEPFAALDALMRESLQELLKAIWAETRTTIFFITHDVDEALLLSSRIVVMGGAPGRIKEDLRNPLQEGKRSAAEIRQQSRYAAFRERLVESLKP